MRQSSAASSGGPSRRTFLAGSLAAAALGVAAPSVAQAATPTLGGAARTAATSAPPPRAPGQRSMIGVPFEPHDVVRVGIIGLGNRGMGMLRLFDAVPGVEVAAVCDVRRERVREASNRLADLGSRRPRMYDRGPDDWQRLAANDDVDFIYIATPWELHFPQAAAALRGGKHVGIELPIATEIDEMWELVNLSEQQRKHCLLMENCNYGRQELAMLRMAHAGVFGELTHGDGGYLHDLRDLLFSETYYYNQWRRAWYTKHNRAFYPMHGLAPIAAAMDVNRGDRLATLQATASPARGLADYRERFVPRSRTDVWQEEYVAGDRVTCMITTEQGRMIRAEHNCSDPRPYSRINTIAGSRGILEDYPSRIYVEPDHGNHQWQNSQPYLREYDHWLWQDIGDDAGNHGGHGGMDYILVYRLMQSMRLGLEPDIDIYDSAAWCSAVPLSELSIQTGAAVDIPDFTRGEWRTYRPGLDSERVPLLEPAMASVR